MMALAPHLPQVKLGCEVPWPGQGSVRGESTLTELWLGCRYCKQNPNLAIAETALSNPSGEWKLAALGWAWAVQ